MSRINKKISEEPLLSEKKIDKIIKKYLLEREELNDDYTEELVDFSEDTKEVFNGMIEGLGEVLVDLDFIKNKEGDVKIYKKYDKHLYADNHLNSLIDKLEGIISELSFLVEGEDTEDI